MILRNIMFNQYEERLLEVIRTNSNFTIEAVVNTAIEEVAKQPAVLNENLSFAGITPKTNKVDAYFCDLIKLDWRGGQHPQDCVDWCIAQESTKIHNLRITDDNMTTVKLLANKFNLKPNRVIMRAFEWFIRTGQLKLAQQYFKEVRSSNSKRGRPIKGQIVHSLNLRLKLTTELALFLENEARKLELTIPDLIVKLLNDGRQCFEEV